MVINPICFSCGGAELRRNITGQRMMCPQCESIFAIDFPCQACSGKKRTKVLMKVAAPGRVRCPLCNSEKEAPGLNLDTMMTREAAARVHRNLSSIPPKNRVSSIPRHANRGSRGLHSTSPSPKEEDGWQPTILPVKRRDNSAESRVINQLPKVEVVEDNGELFWIVAELPGHKTIEEIQRRMEGGKLILKSNLFARPYRAEVELPNWAEEPAEINFRNGFLEMKFRKK